MLKKHDIYYIIELMVGDFVKSKKKSKKGGFTLVELLATVTLLAIIAMISFVSINAVIKNNKKTQYDNLKKSIRVAVRDYVSDNKYKGEFENPVNLKTLVDSGYLTGPVIDPYTNKEIENYSSIKVTITLDGNGNVSKIEFNNYMPKHD